MSDTGVYLVDHPPKTRQFRSPRREDPSGVIVVHTAESAPDIAPEDRGAENVAAFIANRTDYGSYHVLADSDSCIQLVRYTDEAFHDATGSNPHSFGLSAATQAARWDTLPEWWVAGTLENMAVAAADYATWLHRTHGITIPAVRINRELSEDRIPGFISHAERDPARRTDPGSGFPWDRFLRLYEAEMNPDTTRGKQIDTALRLAREATRAALAAKAPEGSPRDMARDEAVKHLRAARRALTDIPPLDK